MLKNKLTGKEYPDILAAKHDLCTGITCDCCDIADITFGNWSVSCSDWCAYHPKEAAKIFGIDEESNKIYINPKTQTVYPSIALARKAYCEGFKYFGHYCDQECENCALRKVAKEEDCWRWARSHPEEAAKVMGLWVYPVPDDATEA